MMQSKETMKELYPFFFGAVLFNRMIREIFFEEMTTEQKVK